MRSSLCIPALVDLHSSNRNSLCLLHAAFPRADNSWRATAEARRVKYTAIFINDVRVSMRHRSCKNCFWSLEHEPARFTPRGRCKRKVHDESESSHTGDFSVKYVCLFKLVSARALVTAEAACGRFRRICKNPIATKKQLDDSVAKCSGHMFNIERKTLSRLDLCN
jgi:hypothetical protein